MLPLALLVITGGHDFERPQFTALFDSFEGMTWREAQHPNANDSYAPEAARSYDVLVLYDLNQQITEEQQAALLAMLRSGKGLVVLHHALADYQAWDDWLQVVGGRFYLAPTRRGAETVPASTWRHGVDIPVRVVDPKHPVTRGLSDFTIHDEVYGGYEVLPRAHPLLTTDHPESSPTLAWTNWYGNSRVVTIQLGHDHFAYENPNYRRLVSQAIRWVARRP
ncbi:MAG: ThuA domain-containing protein [Armatimonadetes bacterium]|nr:ThuA domain-containing protein [Armatimonadota bacterium]